ncbi:YfjI family protein [Aeromonas veronii]|uniref:YfjI family protein n=1 Tax=Aeromonas veronii TaxID=654 RepID=UPI002F402CE3
MKTRLKQFVLCPPGEFPTYALPTLIQDELWRCIEHYQVTAELAVPIILSAMGAAVHDGCNVKVNDDIQHQTTLYILNVAPSGSGKTFCFNKVYLAFREVENQLQKEYSEEQLAYVKDLRIWSIKEKAAERALTKALKGGVDTERYEDAIGQLQEEKPKPPLNKKLILNDITPAALMRELGLGNHSFSIATDEGVPLFKTLLTETPNLNNLWSVGAIAMRRVNRPDVDVNDARVGLTLMVQPKAFQKYIFSQGETVRDNGFLCRCLISRSVPVNGKTFSRDTSQQNHDSLNWFQKRLTDLLLHSIERRRRGERFHTITLSEEALTYWSEIHTDFMYNVRHGGVLEKYADYVYKFLEHCTRIAAVIEVFTHGHVEQVSLESMKAGYAIANWYLDHFIEIMSEAEGSNGTSNAEAVDAWLKDKIYWEGYVECDKNHVRQSGPPCIRSKDRLDAALAILESEGKVILYKSGQTNMVKYSEAVALHDYRNFSRSTLLGGSFYSSVRLEQDGIKILFDRDDLDKVPEYRAWSKQK